MAPAPSEEFLKYLKSQGVLSDPQKYVYQVRDLLARMERANVLVSFPSHSPNVMHPKSYYALHEVSAIRGQGLLWLASTLRGRFVHAQVSPAVVHIVGNNNEGEGSGVVFDPQHVLTCRHVVSGMAVATTQTFQGRSV